MVMRRHASSTLGIEAVAAGMGLAVAGVDQTSRRRAGPRGAGDLLRRAREARREDRGKPGGRRTQEGAWVACRRRSVGKDPVSSKKEGWTGSRVRCLATTACHRLYLRSTECGRSWASLPIERGCVLRRHLFPSAKTGARRQVSNIGRKWTVAEVQGDPAVRCTAPWRLLRRRLSLPRARWRARADRAPSRSCGHASVRRAAGPGAADPPTPPPSWPCSRPSLLPTMAPAAMPSAQRSRSRATQPWSALPTRTAGLAGPTCSCAPG